MVQGRKLDPATVHQIKALAQRGFSRRAIARELNVARCAVDKYVTDYRGWSITCVSQGKASTPFLAFARKRTPRFVQMFEVEASTRTAAIDLARKRVDEKEGTENDSTAPANGMG